MSFGKWLLATLENAVSHPTSDVLRKLGLGSIPYLEYCCLKVNIAMILLAVVVNVAKDDCLNFLH